MTLGKKDFFISYTGVDEQIASWIAWTLEEAGYSVVFQAWDFRSAGKSVIGNIDKATKACKRTIAVISPDYFNSEYTIPEWETAVNKDLTGDMGLLVPVIVRPYTSDGILGRLADISFIDKDEKEAKTVLLDGLKPGRIKPTRKPPYKKEIRKSLGQKPRFPGTLPPVWNIPRRNPIFTGRDQILLDLRSSLNKTNSTTLTQLALHGLGGIGKSQLAIEYAYRNNASYDYAWWIRSEEKSNLTTDYTNLAKELNLPEKDAEDQAAIVVAVRQWLNEHTGWLLIFDNAKDAASICEYLPQDSAGHVLITSRNPDWRKIGTPLNVSVWQRSESINFLQKRTGKKDELLADKISEALGDLPLALEQAGAYIESKQKCFADYLEDFQSRRKELWNREKILWEKNCDRPDQEEITSDYPDTVATTWNMAFDAIENVSFAKELLFFCSIVAPDDIPKSMIRNALEYAIANDTTSIIIDSFDLDDAIEALCSYSLITSNTDSFSIHRLVQVVTIDRINDINTAIYKNAILKTISEHFPKEGYRDPSCWPKCINLLPHAEIIIDNNISSSSYLTNLISSMGSYFFGIGDYDKAITLYSRSLSVRKKHLGNNHPDVAASLSDLGETLIKTGNLRDAEDFFRKAIKIGEITPISKNFKLGEGLANLANLLRIQGDFEKAEPIARSAIDFFINYLGHEHTNTALSLNNLGLILESQGKYDEAMIFYQKALSIDRKIYGEYHTKIALILNNIGVLLDHQNKFKEAEKKLRMALTIRQKILDIDHPDIAQSLNNLGVLLCNQGNYINAEKLFDRAINIAEKKFKKDSPEMKLYKENLTNLKARTNNRPFRLSGKNKITHHLKPLLIKYFFKTNQSLTNNYS